MRFITITALLNAYLLVALPGLPSLPKLPGGPNLPNAPTYNTPSQPGREPGRLPTQNQNPQPALEPGRLPDRNQNPNAPGPEQPGRLPVPIPVVQTPPQKPKPKRPSCAGRRRAECEDEGMNSDRSDEQEEDMSDDLDEEMSDNLDEDMEDYLSDVTDNMDDTEFNKIAVKGREMIQLLDGVRTNPPKPPNTATHDMMLERYQISAPDELREFEDLPMVFKQEKGISDPAAARRDWWVTRAT